MRRLLTIIALLLLVGNTATACCCTHLGEKIRYAGALSATHLSSSGVNLWVAIENNSAHAVVISRGYIEVCANGRPMATISLRDKVIVPRRSEGEVLVPLRFKSHTLVAVWQLLRSIGTGQRSDITLNYKIRVGTRTIRKTLSGDGVALAEFMEAFAIPRAVIEDFSQLQ